MGGNTKGAWNLLLAGTSCPGYHLCVFPNCARAVFFQNLVVFPISPVFPFLPFPHFFLFPQFLTFSIFPFSLFPIFPFFNVSLISLFFPYVSIFAFRFSLSVFFCISACFHFRFPHFRFSILFFRPCGEESGREGKSTYFSFRHLRLYIRCPVCSFPGWNLLFTFRYCPGKSFFSRIHLVDPEYGDFPT